MRMAKCVMFFALFLAYLPICLESKMVGNGTVVVKKARRKEMTWCIAKPSTESGKLYENIEYSCKQAGVDCRAIAAGGNCFQPDTAVSRASFAMNLYYKAMGKNSWDCHFDATGLIISENPSIGACIYPI